MHTHSTANYRFHTGFFGLGGGGGGGGVHPLIKVLRSLAHPPAQGAGFPSSVYT